MKYNLKIILSCLMVVVSFTISTAQDSDYEFSTRDEVVVYSFGIQGFYAPFLGNNFLSKHYNSRPGYILETRVGLKDFVGFGAFLAYNRGGILDNSILGNDFIEGRLKDSGFFLYYQYPIAQRIGIEPQLGYAFSTVKHDAQGDIFKLDYQNVFLGLNGNFYINNRRDLALFGGVRYARYFTNSISVNENDLTFIKQSHRLVLQAGFRWEIFR